jgi:hypothetical protein
MTSATSSEIGGNFSKTSNNREIHGRRHPTKEAGNIGDVIGDFPRYDSTREQIFESALNSVKLSRDCREFGREELFVGIALNGLPLSPKRLRCLDPVSLEAK